MYYAIPETKKTFLTFLKKGRVSVSVIGLTAMFCEYYLGVISLS